VDMIHRELYRTRSEGRTRLLGLVLSGLEMNDEKTMCWARLTEDMLAKAHALREDNEGIVNYLLEIQGGLRGVKFADVTQALLEHSSEALFYRTDHHWTSLGAAYAFRGIAPALGIQPPEMDAYTVYTVSTIFEGTLASKSGSHSAVDEVQIYVPDTDVEYYVTYPGEDPICSMYNREALEQKDHYKVFFGGNYSRVDITTTADTGRNLLVFKDSYANCMMQFLYPHFDHITMIDPRYYYDNVQTVLNSQAITDVLYLYNADTFLTDHSLADVLGTE